MVAQRLTTDICIAGGGPAGMMLGLLLARAGVDVIVLEKHADFFRDFRGDTVHPSTLDLIDQLGLRATFEAIPHTRLRTLDMVVNGIRLHAIDFGLLHRPNAELALMPQWDLLDLLATEAKKRPSFTLVMNAEVTGLTHRGNRIAGVRARTPDGVLRIDAALTIGADGRDSTVRRALRLPVQQHGVPIDVLWFRLDKPAAALPDTLGWISNEAFVVTIPRPDYLQCGLLIPKGSLPALRDTGLPAFRARVASAVPRLAQELERITDWDEIKLLSVQIDQLTQWSVPGALCIGDAAHAMSPAFGVGINCAIQDAVATANILVPLLRAGADAAALDAGARAVERRRARPTERMQRIQLALHRTIAKGGAQLLHAPPTRRERVLLANLLPVLRPLAVRLIGYGFRPERIDAAVLDPTPGALSSADSPRPTPGTPA
ncbi:MAG TPA: FAD-dependent oxidoreductase [Pseudolysinimonas sp.]|nr:FAD-dependent oxidoreductase [Pseudolysinimonas sp.]